MSRRREAFAVRLIDAASRGDRAQFAGGVVAATGQAFGADPLLFEKAGEKVLRFGEGLFASPADIRGEPTALLAPLVPQPRPSSSNLFQAADDLLLASQKSQQPGIVVGFDQLKLAVRKFEQVGNALPALGKRLQEFVGGGHGFLRGMGVISCGVSWPSRASAASRRATWPTARTRTPRREAVSGSVAPARGCSALRQAFACGRSNWRSARTPRANQVPADNARRSCCRRQWRPRSVPA